MDVSERTHRRRRRRIAEEVAELARIFAVPPRRRRWPNADPVLAKWLCAMKGRELGGRPARERRCTKRLGSRRCWGWRAPGSDRCYLHPRG